MRMYVFGKFYFFCAIRYETNQEYNFLLDLACFILLDLRLVHLCMHNQDSLHICGAVLPYRLGTAATAVQSRFLLLAHEKLDAKQFGTRHEYIYVPEMQR